ncbi:hypothetical protein GCM10025858_17130 [Alicyclobacillus sacchari]|nr:hypothetical protein GCM10025858_17130 [Alicyclobacillus sacchari]
MVNRLQTDHNLGWRIVDAKQAQQGMLNGTYIMAITIPPDFSQDAANAATTPGAPQPTIESVTNDRHNYIAGIVGRNAMVKLEEQTASQLARSYAENVVSGLVSAQSGLRAASTGLPRLPLERQASGGGGSLVRGAKQVASGGVTLANKLQTATTAAGQLASGVAQTQHAAAQLADSMVQLSRGAAQVQTGVGQLQSGSTALASGANRAATGANQVAGGAKQVADGLAELAKANPALASSPQFQTLLTASQQVAAGSAQVAAANQSLATSAQKLAGGAEQVAQGSEALSAGTAKAASGAQQLALGEQRIAIGANQLAAGISSLQRGAVQLAAGTQGLQQGVGRYTSGVASVASGAETLASRLHTAAQSMPAIHHTQLVNAIANPVGVHQVEAGNINTYGNGFAPYFLSLGLYVGVLLMSVIISFRDPRNPVVRSLVVFLKVAHDWRHGDCASWYCRFRAVGRLRRAYESSPLVRVVLALDEFGVCCDPVVLCRSHAKSGPICRSGSVDFAVDEQFRNLSGRSVANVLSKIGALAAHALHSGWFPIYHRRRQFCGHDDRHLAFDGLRSCVFGPFVCLFCCHVSQAVQRDDDRQSSRFGSVIAQEVVQPSLGIVEETVDVHLQKEAYPMQDNNQENRHPEWEREQAYVDRVVQKMEAKLIQMQADVSLVRGEVVDIRRHFWDDVTVNVSNPDDLVETHFAIRQQAEILAERERRWHRAAEAAQVLEKQKSTPFFARIDFREQGEADTERVYIGIASFRDEETDDFLVYDWRAPIASVYYDHTPGPVSFAAPRGEIRGEMTLKRQFVIRGGNIFAMFDAGITIGDELLMYALSGRADAKMKNIVATIQREQNRVIRDDTSPVLVVRGAAGSGKTSAALQRAAYLLYKHRGACRPAKCSCFRRIPCSARTWPTCYLNLVSKASSRRRFTSISHGGYRANLLWRMDLTNWNVS